VIILSTQIVVSFAASLASEGRFRVIELSEHASMVSAKSLRILLVEDHEDFQRMLVSALSDCGHAVSAVKTGNSALALAATAPFDIVLCDFNLDDGNGVDLMKDLKARYGLRGICLSGYEEEDLGMARCEATAFDEFLVKGVGFDVIKSTIEKVVALPLLKTPTGPK